MRTRQWIAVAAVTISLQIVSAQQSQPLPSERMSPGEINAEPSLAPTGLPGEDLQLEPVMPAPEPPSAPFKLRLQPAPVVTPILPPLEPGTGAEKLLSTVPSLFVRKFDFRGNHVYSSRTLADVIQSYTGRRISPEDLEQARQMLTVYYVSHGYINSGAVLEDQNPAGGVITFDVVEGTLTDIKVTGNRWFRKDWIRRELQRAAGSPLNFDNLKTGLQLLRQNPLISQVNGELRPGGAPGESILDAQIKDTQPFQLGLDFNNSRPPSVGSEILNAHFVDLNLTGNDDPLRLDYGILESTRSQDFKASGWDNVDGTYSIAFTPWDTAFAIHGSKSDTAIAEEPFTTLDISSRLEEYGYAIRQPLYQTLTDDLSVSIAFDSERDKTFLLGEPFSLSPGAVNGVSDVSVIRFAQEYVNRSQVHVFAARSTFNLGVAALGATVNGAGEADTRFFSWLGQTQYIRRLHDTDNLLVLRINGQLSNSPLLAPEEFSIGGSDSVRGYRENELLRDNGVFGSVELRVPVIHGKGNSQILVLAPFFDIGAGWNTLANTAGSSTAGNALANDSQGDLLPSAGIGLIFTPSSRVHADLYWGYGFNSKFIQGSKTDPQDYGITFAISVDAF